MMVISDEDDSRPARRTLSTGEDRRLPLRAANSVSWSRKVWYACSKRQPNNPPKAKLSALMRRARGVMDSGFLT
jgi:hypothetical protein